MFDLRTCAIGIALTVVFITTRFLRASKASLPPGPPPRGLAGNIHQITTPEYWKIYKMWSDSYGPIVYYRIYGRKFIILNDIKSIMDILETRSSNFSDRPRAWMYKELVGRKLAVFNISSQHERFKTYRKILNSGLNARAVENYYPLFREETDRLLENLSEAPQDFISHFRRNSGAIILKLAYGWTVSDNQDPFVRLMEEAFVLQSQITKPGRWLVDVFPILRFVPSWFPGAGFRKMAEEFKKEMNKVNVVPYQWAKEQIVSGSYVPSFTSQYLLPDDGHEVGEEEEDIIKWCAGALYAGGADTTVAFMTAFIAAMTLYPEAQMRAHKEISANLDRDQVPKPSDQESLLYVNALIKEVLRWAPPAPLGLPHRVIGDDIYNGYRIPEGSTIFANIWAICRDESVYHDPLEFKPERFIPSDGMTVELDPRKFVFGFGRRICPGAQFAESSVFINVVSILQRFIIGKAVDKDGAEITPTLEFSATITSHIKPFPCSIKERRNEM